MLIHLEIFFCIFTLMLGSWVVYYTFQMSRTTPHAFLKPIAFFILFASISQGLKEDIMDEIARREEALAEQRVGFFTLMSMDVFNGDMFNETELEELEVFVSEYCIDHNTTGEIYPLAINLLQSAEPDSDDMFVIFGMDPEKGIKYDFHHTKLASTHVILRTRLSWSRPLIRVP